MFNQNFNVCFKYQDRFILLKFISLNERKRFAALWYTANQAANFVHAKGVFSKPTRN